MSDLGKKHPNPNPGKKKKRFDGPKQNNGNPANLKGLGKNTKLRGFMGGGGR